MVPIINGIRRSEIKVFKAKLKSFGGYGDILLPTISKRFIKGGYTHIQCEKDLMETDTHSGASLVFVGQLVAQQAGNGEFVGVPGAPYDPSKEDRGQILPTIRKNEAVRQAKILLGL